MYFSVAYSDTLSLILTAGMVCHGSIWVEQRWLVAGGRGAESSHPHASRESEF